jgi:signal transduction histidine kinase
MSEEQKTRIFDDFYTTKADGTGLGLSIVRRLVMDLDGRIDVESDEDEGTRMIIHLPTAGVEPERGE